MFTKIIAVVGGTGFLGRHVVAALESAGYEVRPLSRRTGFDGLRPAAAALRGCDAVVNLAGIKREQGAQTFHAVHVELTERLVRSMKEAGVPRLIHISVVVARPAPDLPYHDTKWKGEQVVRASGLDWTILRPGVIYGNGDDMLGHLSLMIRTAPVFPIAGAGTAPMRPVDARDVATAVAAALKQPSSGRTYDVVGPDRLTLRTVVTRVAEAIGLPLSIWTTPVWLMRIPVWLMERTMRQPLSTTAQLAMLVEGLDGDPAPARRDLGLETVAFTAAHLRPLLGSAPRRFPFDLRLFSAPRPTRQMPTAAAVFVLTFVLCGLTLMFGYVSDIWMGMTLAMPAAALLAMAVFPSALARRLKPSLFGLASGCAAGLLLYGMTAAAAAGLATLWPGWDGAARQLYAWQGGHSRLFLAPTLVLIVLAEEMVWRGIVTQFLMERWGRAAGISAAALLYALAHWAAFNPLLWIAALGCGLFWGWLYAATGNLTAPLISHLLWDILLMFVLPVVG